MEKVTFPPIFLSGWCSSWSVLVASCYHPFGKPGQLQSYSAGQVICFCFLFYLAASINKLELELVNFVSSCAALKFFACRALSEYYIQIAMAADADAQLDCYGLGKLFCFVLER